MQLEHIVAKDSLLQDLLHQSRYWRSLDKSIKKMLPENLHAYFHVVCISQGDLIIHATSPMAATRLRMLLPMLLSRIREQDSHIVQVVVKVLPQDNQVKKEKTFRISPQALGYFEETAKHLTQHPELAHALQQLVIHNRQVE